MTVDDVKKGCEKFLKIILFFISLKALSFLKRVSLGISNN